MVALSPSTESSGGETSGGGHVAGSDSSHKVFLNNFEEMGMKRNWITLFGPGWACSSRATTTQINMLKPAGNYSEHYPVAGSDTSLIAEDFYCNYGHACVRCDDALLVQEKASFIAEDSSYYSGQSSAVCGGEKVPPSAAALIAEGELYSDEIIREGCSLPVHCQGWYGGCPSGGRRAAEL